MEEVEVHNSFKMEEQGEEEEYLLMVVEEEETDHQYLKALV